MQRTLRQLITESRILKAVLIFFLSYIFLSILWVQLKDIYGYGITFVASKFVAGVKDARLEELVKGEDVINATFSARKAGKLISVNVPVKVSPYFANVPLTISMLVSLSLYIKRRKRAYAEALLILLLFHLLHVFFFGTLELTKTFMGKGVEAVSLMLLSFYQFFWGLMEYASMSFAPFLIVIYIFVRFRK